MNYGIISSLKSKNILLNLIIIGLFFFGSIIGFNFFFFLGISNFGLSYVTLLIGIVIWVARLIFQHIDLWLEQFYVACDKFLIWVLYSQIIEKNNPIIYTKNIK